MKKILGEYLEIKKNIVFLQPKISREISITISKAEL
ncbi:hypothetical protein SAMN05444267_104622 [Chryseobacterium polytrichastri]|uniref:Uncharacterized protein n=1 Tax=Chryseobacterium polytrichastri TaxID=1302687 RepID=A0A1M7IGZ9_9FLAO|nr:hypothetical protein SAMN05444267_104622 [Chryseobacterium polytrichastri]